MEQSFEFLLEMLAPDNVFIPKTLVARRDIGEDAKLLFSEIFTEILEDFYNALRSIDLPEAQHVASSLELYVTGSLNLFNHRTNIDINNRLVCFDIKEVGKNLRKLAMLIVQDQVWNRVTINRAAKKSTRYYIDEFHLLLKERKGKSRNSKRSVEIRQRAYYG